METKQRMIQEYVPGKQVTLLHVIASPHKDIYKSLGLDDEGCNSIGILTITPGEAVIVAADIATKAADVSLGFLDRFGGALVITGMWQALRPPWGKCSGFLRTFCSSAWSK